MSWLNSVRNVIPFVVKKETPDHLWHKCKGCGQMVFTKELEDNLNVCPKCDHHDRIGPKARFRHLLDEGSCNELPAPKVPEDPLKFRDSKRYADRLKAARTSAAETDALVNARGTILGHKVVIGVQDFAFMGGSMGLAVGEAFVRGVEAAIADHCPYVIFTASGGARMQEGIQPDADAAYHRRNPDAARCGPALYRRADRSDLGRRDGGLCDAGRRSDCRAQGHAGLYGPPGDREHDPREAAR